MTERQTGETKSNSKMIIASAGSGKTYRITQDTIREISNAQTSLQLLNIMRQIIIMTFTNKATDELRQRIIKELKNKGGDTYNTFLFNHRNLIVSTIDSLLYEIIKPLLLLVKKDNPTNLIVNEGEIIDEVVNRLLIKAISGDKSLGKVISQISAMKLHEGKKVKLNTDLKDWVKQYLNFKGKGIKIYSSKQNIYWDFKNAMDKFIEETYYYMYSEVRNIMEKVANVYLNTIDVDITKITKFDRKAGFHGNKSKKFNALVKFLKHEADSINYEELKKMVDSLKSGQVVEKLLWHKDFNGNVKDLLKDILSDDKQTLFDNNWLSEYALQIKPLSVPQEIFDVLDFISSHLLNAVFTIWLWNHISETIKDILTERHAILLKNIPEILKELLTQSEKNVPYIYEYMGTRFMQYFTDEFQDTSLPQYEALKPLWKEATSKGGNVVVVGDIKQSIYQWRDADPLIMATKFPQDLNPIDESLSSNWRSSPIIVEFNNKVFGEIIPNQIRNHWKELINYQNSITGNYRKGFNLGKMLDMWYAKDKVKQDAKRSYEGTIVVRQLIVTKENSSKRKSDKQNLILEDVINVIDKLINQKGFQYGDITILFRKTDTLKFFATELLARGYPVIVTSGIRLKHDTPSIVMHKILEGMLHKNMSGNVSKLIIAEISSLICKIRTQFNADLCAQDVFKKLLEQENQIWQKNESFNSLSELAITLADRLVTIFPELQDNTTWKEGLQAFLNFVRIAEHKGIHTIQDLLEYWDSADHVFDLTEEDNTSQNQISLMTIHKAKGLQNKVILIPDLYDWKFEIDHQNAPWIPVPIKALKEFMNKINGNSNLLNDAKDDEYILIKFPSSKKLLSLIRFDVNAQENLGLSGIISALAEHEAKYIFETLNLLYVGFTRPEQALFLWSVTQSDKQDKPKSAEDLINYLVTDQSIKFEMKNSEGSQDSESESIQIKQFVKGDWNTLTPHSQEHKNRDEEKENAEIKPLGENQTWKAYPDKYFDVNLPVNKTTIKDLNNFSIVQGIYLHKLIAQVKTIDDIENLDIDTSHKQKLRQWLNHTELKNLSTWEVKTEVPLFHNNQLFYADRIYTNSNNEVVIVDFKSVDHPSQSPLWNKWQEQVKTYAEILKQQGRNVKAVYIVGFKEVATVNHNV